MSSPSSSSSSDQEPLLQRPHSPSSSTASYDSISKSAYDEEDIPLSNSNVFDRSVENDVLPESAVVGRNLGWSSAYILTMSISAILGQVLQSVGCPGIASLLWIASALIAWLRLVSALRTSHHFAMAQERSEHKTFIHAVFSGGTWLLRTRLV